VAVSFLVIVVVSFLVVMVMLAVSLVVLGVLFLAVAAVLLFGVGVVGMQFFIFVAPLCLFLPWHNGAVFIVALAIVLLCLSSLLLHFSLTWSSEKFEFYKN